MSSARIDTYNLPSTVKTIMVSLKLDGVHGEITEVSPTGRVHVTFNHNNKGDEINEGFWFDADVVIVKIPLSEETWLD